VPHPQVMFMIRLLAAVSWADGQLEESEAAAIERLINAANLDEDERAKARSWLAAPVELDPADVGALNMNQRLATYQAAVRIALSDEKMPDEERMLLDRIRDALGLSVEQALEIEAEMPRHD
jgi:uncharacterized tellurite resistance protein B-like protein